MKCNNCIKKDMCKINNKYRNAKEMVEETLFNIEDENIFEVDLLCKYFKAKPFFERLKI